MNKGLTLVGGLGLGAALMYLFDPDRGSRRRAMIRDKVESAGNKAVDKAEKMGRDLGNRAYGVVAETKALFRHEDVTDDVLVDRVRARLGRMPVHLGAIEVTAADGVVTLRGNILSEEVPKVLRAVRYVRGVKSVNDELTVQESSQQISDLQGQPQPLGAR